MRTKVWKDSLYIGRWITPRGQVFDCAEPDLDYFHGRAKAMLSKGTPLPWGTEHDDVETVTKLSAAERIARWAERTKGHLHDVRIIKLMRPDATGKEVLQPVMQFEMDVDDKDRPMLEACKNVSPEIYPNIRNHDGPASDDTGPYWPGQSIAWLAVTPVPVQYPQRPFDFSSSDPVSLSAATVSVSLSSATYFPVSLGMGTATAHAPAGTSEGGQFSSASAATSKARASTQQAGEATDKAAGEHNAENHGAAELAHRQAQAHHLQASTAHRAAGAPPAVSKTHDHEADFHSRMADIHGNASKSCRGVSLSAADEDDAAAPPAGDAPPDPDADLGEDLEPGGPPLPPGDSPPVGDPAGDAARIHRLAGTLKELGMVVTPTPGMDLGTFVDHCCTSCDTHKATKALSEDAKADEEDAANPNQQPDPNQQQPLDPEISESQPIMMGTAMSLAEQTELAALRKDKVKAADLSVKSRMTNLKARGIIDQAMENEQLALLKTIPIALSAARPGELETNPVEITVRAWERLLKTGKAGMFAPSTARQAPKGSATPIADAVALSGAREEVVNPPYEPDANDQSRENVPLDKRVLERWGITANGKLA